jgi:hypothetical protein
MKPVKQWPENDEPAIIDDLAKEVTDAIRFAYKLNRKNLGKDIPLAGPDAPGEGWRVNVHTDSYELSAESLDYGMNRGRDALEELVYLAINLGCEQGRRITMSSGDGKRLRDKLDAIKSIIR